MTTPNDAQPDASTPPDAPALAAGTPDYSEIVRQQQAQLDALQLWKEDAMQQIARLSNRLSAQATVLQEHSTFLLKDTNYRGS